MDAGVLVCEGGDCECLSLSLSYAPTDKGLRRVAQVTAVSEH